MTLKKKVIKKKSTSKNKKKKTVKILPMIIVTGEDKQTYMYKSENGFMSEEDFKLFDSLLGKRISIQIAKETRLV